ncbi:microvitellogenin [Bombyx mori]|uniref:Uncharacterized protein n=2 Tax=Bombyx mori TaxID=7091 RepID=A0A8R2AKZ3_BOMMO|nr:microvitellogenin [Bombyx mori]
MDPHDHWKSAKRPNYVTNVDLKYPYSELPYTAQYKLLKLPITGELIEHVDYWGEGSIVNGGLYSGFRDCYNVNRQYQVVSNGSDKGHKIPNRIPVRDENDCDTRAYIKDDSVKIVTLMSAPIIPNSARDITRIVNERVGMVVIYGMPVESQGIKLLAAELKNKLLLYCPDYELSDYLQEPTMMDSHVAFLNKQLLVDLLVKYVSTGDYDKAVTTTKFLKDDNVGFVIEELIDRLLHARESNMFAYADKLWSAGHHDIVNDFFPSEVKLITKQERVKIIGRHYNQALKLDSHLDWYNDRLAWGDSKDKTSHRMSWKLIPVWENNKLLYKIMNTEHTMYLKLDKSVDGYGDRKAWGSNNSEEKRHLWKLTPVVLETGNVLLIENHEYGQGLKLDASVDWYGDRLLWGNNGNVNGNPSYFGWVIDAWQ